VDRPHSSARGPFSVLLWDWCNGDDDTSARVLWTTRRGVTYRVQVTGGDPSQFGAFVLTVVGTADPLVPFSTGACHVDHTRGYASGAPSHASLLLCSARPRVRTHSLADGVANVLCIEGSHGKADDGSDKCSNEGSVQAPTASDPPTQAPAVAPIPTCSGPTTYHVHNATSNRPVRRIFNNTATCLVHPYNVEVRPCRNSNVTVVLSAPVQIRLVSATTRLGGAVLHSSRPQRSSPLRLFGPPAATRGDAVPPSPKALPNGRYYLSATATWGRLAFTQRCPS
jgi:hypothetical protein